MQNTAKARLGGALRSVKDRLARVARVIKKILLAVKLLTLSLYAVYLIYEIVTGAFILFKSILLGLTVAYAIFYTIKHDKIDKPSRAAKKLSRRLYSASKIFINGCTLALTVFGLFAATVTTTLWSVTLAVFMLIGWVTSLFFEILYLIVERQVEKITDAAKEKAKAVSAKITSVRTRGAARLASSKMLVGGKKSVDGDSDGESVCEEQIGEPSTDTASEGA